MKLTYIVPHDASDQYLAQLERILIHVVETYLLSKVHLKIFGDLQLRDVTSSGYRTFTKVGHKYGLSNGMFIFSKYKTQLLLHE